MSRDNLKLQLFHISTFQALDYWHALPCEPFAANLILLMIPGHSLQPGSLVNCPDCLSFARTTHPVTVSYLGNPSCIPDLRVLVVS